MDFHRKRLEEKQKEGPRFGSILEDLESDIRASNSEYDRFKRDLEQKKKQEEATVSGKLSDDGKDPVKERSPSHSP